MTKNKDSQHEKPPIFRREDGFVNIDLDRLSPRQREEMEAILADKAEFPQFQGEVEHGYPLTRVQNPEICPRCGSTTTQQIAEFIYATTWGSRAAIAPAGRFCSDCPTVIVDQKMIEKAMAVKGRFLRTVGVLEHETGNPMYFSTWRGEKPIYFLDENEQIEDMRIPSDDALPAGSSNVIGSSASRAADKKKKQKRKQAKANRKRNRKRK